MPANRPCGPGNATQRRHTLARTLRGAGYATGLSGKRHSANTAFVAPLRSRDDGKYFDRYSFDFTGPIDPAPE